MASRDMSSYLPRYYVMTWSKCYVLTRRIVFYHKRKTDYIQTSDAHERND